MTAVLTSSVTGLASSGTGPGLAHGQVGRNDAAEFDVERVRRNFPILAEKIYGKPLVYLDSAATSQKPQVVIDAMSRFLLKENANAHRGVHKMFQFSGFAHLSVYYLFKIVGCPIQVSTD